MENTLFPLLFELKPGASSPTPSLPPSSHLFRPGSESADPDDLRFLSAPAILSLAFLPSLRSPTAGEFEHFEPLVQPVGHQSVTHLAGRRQAPASPLPRRLLLNLLLAFGRAPESGRCAVGSGAGTAALALSLLSVSLRRPLSHRTAGAGRPRTEAGEKLGVNGRVGF